MGAHDDPIDAIIGGFFSPLKIWLMSFILYALAALTASSSVSEDFFVHLVLNLTIVVPIFEWLFAGSVGLVGFLALASILGISYYAMLDRISPRVYAFGVYASSFLFLTVEVFRAERWWLALALFVTVAIYYWYAYPLMIRQRERNRYRDEMG